MMKNEKILLLILISLMYCGTIYAQAPVDHIKFSHKYHLQEEELECSDCHAKVQDSKIGSDDLLPTKETCADCHDVEAKDNCQKCHTNPDVARDFAPIKTYSKKFPHNKHLGAGLDCADCHSNVSDADYGEKVTLPDMITCMGCHEQKQQSTNCRTCHAMDENLRPKTHGLDFVRAHGQQAQSNAVMAISPKTCTTCHKTSFCEDCHEGENLSRKTHPLNFEFTHALEARSNEKNCTTCHSDRSFCSSCHLENHVIPQNHTAGWSNNIPGDGGRHRFEALSDLENCMSCHEENAEQICQTCHVSKGVVR